MEKLFTIVVLLLGLAYSQSIAHCNSYIIDNQGQLSCMRCHIPFYLVHGECQQCPQGKKLIKNICVQTEGSSFKISKCVAYQSNNNKKCKQCQAGYKVHKHQSSKCTVSDPAIFCRLYSHLKKRCLICERGYALNRDKICSKKQTADQILHAEFHQDNSQERSSEFTHNFQVQNQIIEQIASRDQLAIINSKLLSINSQQAQEVEAFRLKNPLKLPVVSFDSPFEDFGPTEKQSINFDASSFHRQSTITPKLLEQSIADKSIKDHEVSEGSNLNEQNGKSQDQIIDPLSIFVQEIKEQGASSPSQKPNNTPIQDQQLGQIKLKSSQQTTQQTEHLQLVDVVHQYPQFPYCTDFVEGSCFACDQRFVLNLIIDECVLLEQDPRGKAKILKKLQNEQDFCHIRDPETEECSECFRNHYYDQEKQKCIEFNRLCRTVNEENGDCLSCYKDYQLTDGNCQKE